MLTVIIPVFNEVNTIQRVIEKVKEIPIEKEIIIVDDGSTDGTREILTALGRRRSAVGSKDAIKIIYHNKNLGRGAAIRTALKHASGNIIIHQDADLEYNPQDYHSLIKPIEDGDFDVVYGSRFLGERKKMPLFIYLGNRLISSMFNLLFMTKISDLMTGYKAFRKETIDGLDFTTSGFELEIEITAKIARKGIKIAEFPISYSARGYREGKKLRAKDFFIILWTMALVKIGKM